MTEIVSAHLFGLVLGVISIALGEAAYRYLDRRGY